MARVAGVDIYLLTVESWNNLVLVRTVGAPTEAAKALVAADIARSAEWLRRSEAGAKEPPSESIAERLAQSLAVDVTDDAGTEFTLIGRSTGGDLSGAAALYCEWTFTPAMAETATGLTVTFTAEDGSAVSRRLTETPPSGRRG
ncbi:hypothetical protein [Actinoplanes xinjiangensis]|uniref:hypothetical protein n=1 Tax=Actinoplanes xinjiangensis TaxID=512350 RepID=UPI0034487F2A